VLCGHGGASAAAAGQRGRSLEGRPLQEEGGNVLRSLCVPEGRNRTSWAALLEAAFQTAPVISSVFTASVAICPNQSF